MSLLAVFFSMLGITGGLVVIDQAGPLANDISFVVERGDTFTAVASRLDEQGALPQVSVLGGRELLLGSAAALGMASDLKAGEYEIPKASSVRDILRIITSGKGVQRSITIPEGWTVWQVVARLTASDHLSGEIVAIPPEGTVMPNTYFVILGEDRQAVLDRMTAAHQTLFDTLWAGRAADLPYRDRQEALIMASIIERETGLSNERGLVASVYVNRLVDGWRLQADPTVIYGITNGQQPLRRGLRRSELLDADNPYNTYQIHGLPPGPIANPSAESIAAALNPERSDFYFFVASCDGGHEFSTTLEEHNRAVAAYRECEASLSAPALPKQRPVSPAYVGFSDRDGH